MSMLVYLSLTSLDSEEELGLCVCTCLGGPVYLNEWLWLAGVGYFCISLCLRKSEDIFIWSSSQP